MLDTGSVERYRYFYEKIGTSTSRYLDNRYLYYLDFGSVSVDRYPYSADGVPYSTIGSSGFRYRYWRNGTAYRYHENIGSSQSVPMPLNTSITSEYNPELNRDQEKFSKNCHDFLPKHNRHPKFDFFLLKCQK